ncbi:ABC-type dipeptide/oligopeptide/nickel transport system ATPase subunit/predicted NBD/HSP70 family sugar kinase [Streptomyces griseochromogenes]|uniref:ABC-type dipeptide/oligopeptide/nickel transport system ATPase subunit/predicted NBD/HSP70 family sugar kinase n=2 Tax=Streptomyces griseochromogenes TaxID=68214 RepID=A0ABS4M6G0_9ACTN|nr:ABC-type dipeptide/oligopeptide/nickel transport system ATPase subunit/predicted NBD/HSP70 family sugar kinase [Streptomyces griseochromogenes]
MELRDVSVRFGRGRRSFRALRDVSLTVHAGETVGLVGESGSGKSTAARVALGLVRAYAGSVTLFGSDLACTRGRPRRSLLSGVGVVLQDPVASLDARMSVAECVAEPLRVHRRGLSATQRRARVVEVLELVRLSAGLATRGPRELSGGQRQRVSLARALVLERRLLVVDEPTSALDVSVQRTVLEVIAELQEELGFACLFVSHDLAVVQEFAQRVVVMRAGAVEEEGPTMTTLLRPKTEYTRRLIAAVPVPDPVLQRRRRAPLGLDPPVTAPAGMLAGVDIGGTVTEVVLCAADLRVIDRLTVPTPAHDGGTAMVSTALDALRLLLDRTPGRLLGVGVGAAGVVDPGAGRILVASGSFRGWAGFPVTAAVEEGLGVPAYLDNDVNAFLRGEVAQGAVVGERHVLGMTLGTGVGGVLWLEGRLYGGPHGAAGEIGHVPGFGALPCTCGGRGHLETLASGRSIAARYAERTGRNTTARRVAEAAALGGPDACAVFETAGASVARALLVTAGLLDVSTFVIGGGVSRTWGLPEPSVRRTLTAEPPVSGRRIRVAPAHLGGDAVAVGAASRARTELAPGTCV